jgi:hypothetical protein
MTCAYCRDDNRANCECGKERMKSEMKPRNNPDSEENQRATKDNERAVFAAKMSIQHPIDEHRATDALDMMRDEFDRIASLTEDKEILGLCERAKLNIEQTVPVVVQRDELQGTLLFMEDQRDLWRECAKDLSAALWLECADKHAGARGEALEALAQFSELIKAQQ